VIEKFTMDGVEVTVECGTPVDLDGLKNSLRGRVEFYDMVSSDKYLRAVGVLAGEVAAKRLDFCEYAKNLGELMAFKDQKLDGGPSSAKTVDCEYEEDRFRRKYKLTIALKATAEEKPLPTYVTAYRALGFDLNNETTVTILGRFAVRESRRGPPTFTTPESVVAYLRKWDLSKDREAVKELADKLAQVLASAAPTTTEGGEEFKANVRRHIESEADGFQKRSADPFMMASGHMGTTEISDTHLAMTLNDIAEEVRDMEWPQGSSVWAKVSGVKTAAPPVDPAEAAISKSGLLT